MKSRQFRLTDGADVHHDEPIDSHTLLTPSRRKKNRLRGRFLGCLVSLLIVSVVAGITVVSVLYPQDPKPKPPFSFDDIFNLHPKTMKPSWLPNPCHAYFSYAKTVDGHHLISLVQAHTGAEEVIANGTELAQRLGYPKPLALASHALSSDARYVSFMIDAVSKWRHSVSGRHLVYDRQTARIFNLSATPALAHPDEQYARWAPHCSTVRFGTDRNRGNAPAVYRALFVRHNDLHVAEWAPGAPVTEVAVTTDGGTSGGDHINGIADWLHEEEIMYSFQAAWWSPNGDRIGFLRFNEAPSPRVLLPHFTNPWDMPLRTDRSRTPSLDYHYSASGQANPRVALTVFDVAARAFLLPERLPLGCVARPDGLACDAVAEDARWPYFVQGLWLDNEQFAFKRQARNATVVEYWVLRVPDGAPATTRLVTQHRVPGNRWIRPTQEMLYMPPHGALVDRWDDFDGSGLYNLVLLRVAGANNSDASFLLPVAAHDEVTKLLGYHRAEDALYYMVAPSDAPMRRRLDRVHLDLKGRDDVEGTGGPTDHTVRRVSHQAGWHEADFWPGDASYYVQTFSTSTTVPTTSLYRAPATVVRTLVNNSALAHTLTKERAMPTVHFFTVKTTDPPMHGMMLRPPNFYKDSRWPALVHVYGGPDSQKVTDRFALGWPTHFASAHGAIVVSVDARGTKARGGEWAKAVKGRAGDLEVEDQLDMVSEYLAKQFYVEAKRIGVFGWSYGGYMTLRMLSHPTRHSLLRTGFAVAPVADWLFYDSAYTERFMEDPETNRLGYIESSLLTKERLDRLANRTVPIAIAHGTEDDNVHPSNAMRLIRALLDREAPFDWWSFPNDHHSINLGRSRRRVWKEVTEFFKKHLVS